MILGKIQADAVVELRSEFGAGRDDHGSLVAEDADEVSARYRQFRQLRKQVATCLRQPGSNAFDLAEQRVKLIADCLMKGDPFGQPAN